ncbi:PP2C family serine/threonine-protein phosphatase [Rhodopseudomonas palustris]|uniref:PP2C family serine/threonine-protein phosphatase n=1 Tax=Rhodopseudomonas palustris TaxID=1076 RepID=UPI0009BB3A5F|nr:PP2C family serine/threonine-protein phosphatase [Rhodopseudomonas palustris]
MSTKAADLPNARVGRHYRVDLHEYLSKEAFRQPYEVFLQGESGPSELEQIGLTLDNQTGEISGVPTLSGHHQMMIREQGNTSPVATLLSLLVNPDPRHLWKELPSDQSAPFPSTDVHFEAYDDTSTPIAAASVRGRAHAHAGGFREDAFKVLYEPNTDWSVIAVADGAGSAHLSRRGASIAVDSATRHLREALNAELGFALSKEIANSPNTTTSAILKPILYELLVSAGFFAAQAIEAESKLIGCAPKDLSTTLLLTAYRRFGDEHFFASFGVGDGLAVIVSELRETAKVMNNADSGDYAGQTRFLSVSEFVDPQRSMDRIHFETTPDFTALLMMTDGVSDPLFGETNSATHSVYDAWKTSIAPFVRPNECIQSNGQSLADWLCFYTPNHHDDRTLAVLWNRGK